MLAKIPIRKTAVLLFLLTHHIEFSMHLVQHNLLLSEEVYGQVLNQGLPVVGLRIQRTVAWNMKPAFQDHYTNSDQHGMCHFPELRQYKRFNWLARLLHLPAVTTFLYALPEGKRANLAVLGRSEYLLPTQPPGFTQLIVSDLSKSELIHPNLYTHSLNWFTKRTAFFKKAKDYRRTQHLQQSEMRPANSSKRR